jgi:antitoxin ParD1/3/4
MAVPITLSAKQEELLNQLLANGGYPNTEAILDAALQGLIFQENLQEDLETLRREVDRGIADIEAGRFTTINENYSETLKQRWRGRLNAQQKSLGEGS